MKKPLTSLLFISASLIFWTGHAPAWEPDTDTYNSRIYEDDRDPNLLPMSSHYTFGAIAKFSDIVGIGVVLEGIPPVSRETGPWSMDIPGYFRIRIEQPFIGCARNQIIHVRQRYHTPPEEPPLQLLQDDPVEYAFRLNDIKFFPAIYPTNDARIVFAVSTNNFDRREYVSLHWKVPHEKVFNPDPNRPMLREYAPQRLPPPRSLFSPSCLIRLFSVLEKVRIHGGT